MHLSASLTINDFYSDLVHLNLIVNHVCLFKISILHDYHLRCK